MQSDCPSAALTKNWKSLTIIKAIDENAKTSDTKTVPL
jgi:hypothetical protein